MQVKSFVLTMGAGVAIGALGAMMLPKSSPVYHAAKDAANTSNPRRKKPCSPWQTEPGGAVAGFVTAPFAFWRAV